MKKKWPESYFRDVASSRWLSYPSTINILDAVTEKKRLLNEYPESSIDIKKIPKEQTANNADQYYFIVLKLIDSDEAFFIIKETKS